VKIENIGCRSADLRIGDRHYCFDGRDDEYPDGEVDLTVADAMEVPAVKEAIEACRAYLLDDHGEEGAFVKARNRAVEALAALKLPVVAVQGDPDA
jgi:hypothetical protein